MWARYPPAAPIFCMNPHFSVLIKLRGMSYRNARKYLKEFGCTKSEQTELIHKAKELDTSFLTSKAEESLDKRSTLARYQQEGPIRKFLRRVINNTVYAPIVPYDY